MNTICITHINISCITHINTICIIHMDTICIIHICHSAQGSSTVCSEYV